MSLSNETLKAFASTVDGSSEAVPSVVSVYYGTVTNIVNDLTEGTSTYYVTIDGSSSEVEADIAMDADVGDRVVCELNNHVLTITGNITKPAQSLKSNSASAVLDEKIEDKVSKIKTGVMVYYSDTEPSIIYDESTKTWKDESGRTYILGDTWYKTATDEATSKDYTAGVYVFTISEDESGTKTASWIETALDANVFRADSITTREIDMDNLQTNIARIGSEAEKHVDIDSDSVDIMDGDDKLASFGYQTLIGSESKSHIDLGYNHLKLIDKEQNPYVYFSDLRDENGEYEITESLLCVPTGGTGLINPGTGNQTSSTEVEYYLDSTKYDISYIKNIFPEVQVSMWESTGSSSDINETINTGIVNGIAFLVTAYGYDEETSEEFDQELEFTTEIEASTGYTIINCVLPARSMAVSITTHSFDPGAQVTYEFSEKKIKITSEAADYQRFYVDYITKNSDIKAFTLGTRASSAPGIMSFSSGSYNNVSGDYSFCHGDSNDIDNNSSSSVIFGSNNEVSSGSVEYASHGFIVGDSNRIHLGSNTSLIGSHLTAYSNDNSLIIGKYNQYEPDALFIIGNGTDENKTLNAFMVDKDGTTWVQTAIRAGSNMYIDTNTSKNTTPESTSAKSYYFRDANDKNRGLLYNYINSSNNSGTAIRTYCNNSSYTDYAQLNVSYTNAGKKGVSTNCPLTIESHDSAIGTVVNGTVESSVSLTKNTWAVAGQITLTPGVWLVSASVSFSSYSTSHCNEINITTNKAANSYFGRTGGYGTHFAKTSAPFTITASSDIVYVNAICTNDANTVVGRDIRAVRIC